MAQVQERLQAECGVGLHDFIVPKLYNEAREAYIISPWISPETARLIINLVNRGVKIHLITTNDTSNRSHVSAMRLLGAGVGSRGALAIGVLLIIIGITFTVLSPLALALLAPGAWLVYRGLGRRARQVHGNLTVRIIRNLHAKAIIIPEAGLVGIGSANLTTHGLHFNLECWVWVVDGELASRIIRAFQ